MRAKIQREKTFAEPGITRNERHLAARDPAGPKPIDILGFAGARIDCSDTIYVQWVV